MLENLHSHEPKVSSLNNEPRKAMHSCTPRCLLAAFTVALCLASKTLASERPNIIWISCEDISPHLGCYEDPHAITPNLDRLAKNAIVYDRAYTTAGVCAPCRSGIITGMYQTTLGTHHMRCVTKLPDSIRCFPYYLRESGYYCTNNSKTDYQFVAPEGTWDESSGKAHWKNRKSVDQPFFAVFNFTGCHESGIAGNAKYRQVTANLSPDQRQDADALTTLPPYYPDTKITREDWKRNYELITAMDAWAGSLIDELKEAGLFDDTIIFFWSDHGVGLPRAKRWLYESGTHIPLIIYVPEKFRSNETPPPGTRSTRLVSSIDLGPTVLSLAGLSQPNHVQGLPFLGPNPAAPREYVYGARDRMDERYDIIRMVRDKKFRYLRNYEPQKAYYQYINTAEQGATMKEIRRVEKTDSIPSAVANFLASTKPVEELYDVDQDPWELNNLATDPRYGDVLKRMRAAHMQWVDDTRDLGLIPEPELAIRERDLGSQFAIFASSDSQSLVKRLRDTAQMAGEADPSNLESLVNQLSDQDSAVRYWAATGLANLGHHAKPAHTALREALRDPSPVVQVATASALAKSGDRDIALQTLSRILLQGTQWERLHAAIALDELDELSRPVIPQMKEALKYEKSFLADGKYRVRVINHALNRLLGTNDLVP